MANVSEAFLKLVEIADQSRNQASDLPSREEAVTHWTGVGFTLGKVDYVAPMGEVAEILQVPRFTKVPGVRQWVKGVANVRGRLMPVLDLMQFFDKASGFQTRRRRLLVIDKDELYSGIVVDEVRGMQHFPLDSFEANPDDVDEVMKPYVIGAYSRPDGSRAIVFSPYKLAEDPRFVNVAS